MNKVAMLGENNVVTNIVIYEVGFEFEHPDTHKRIEITGKRGIRVGDVYDPATGQFNKP
jgi:hypothetical protein